MAHGTAPESSKHVLVAGNPTLDVNTIAGRSREPRLGGTGPITALALARFGHRAVLLGHAGADLGGLLAPLDGAGVELALIPSRRTLRFWNTYTDPVVPEHRAQRAGDPPPPIPARAVEEILDRSGGAGGFGAALIGPLIAGDIEAGVLELLRARGIPIAIDVQGLLRSISPGGAIALHDGEGIRSSIEGIDLLHASAEEAALLGARGAGAAEALGARYRLGMAAVTSGGSGSVVWTAASGSVAIPGYLDQNLVVDPTGCGDIYLAILLHGLLSGWDPARAGRAASMAAALNAIHEGIHCPAAPEVAARLAAEGG